MSAAHYAAALAASRRGPLDAHFFDIRGAGEWSNINLNTVPVLFCNFVAVQRLKGLFVARMSASSATPNGRPPRKTMLSSTLGPGNYGADLIELTNSYSSYPLTILKQALNPVDDVTLIHENELCGMFGDPEKLRARLIRYFETGVNWDDSKRFLFPNITLPEPVQQRPAQIPDHLR
jgi:hypothetical protein